MSREYPTPEAMAGEALYEIVNIQQVSGEPKRRWFFSHEMDLIVWLDELDQPASFQLSYDRDRDERTLRWKPGQGFTHYEVENARRTTGPATALLMPAGPFDAAGIRSRFLALSSGIPWTIADFVADRLRAHVERRSQATIESIVTAVAVIAVPLLIIACLGSLRGRSREDHD